MSTVIVIEIEKDEKTNSISRKSQARTGNRRHTQVNRLFEAGAFKEEAVG
jgi:hypothetical protein